MRVPECDWAVNFLVQLDDGRVKVLNGYGVQHNVSRGPAKVPDIIGNAYGVILSYAESVQNRAAVAWNVDEVNDRLRRQILDAADVAWERSDVEGIAPRLVVNAIAVERVVEATRVRGQYP